MVIFSGIAATNTIVDRHERSSLLAILQLLRSGKAMSRPELIEVSGLGRRVVDQRVDSLIRSGLVGEGPLSQSRGGRPASPVVFRPEAGIVLVADVSPSVIRAGYADLSGRLIEWREDLVTVAMGPEVILDRLEACWDQLLQENESAASRLMAIGIGVIGPVDTVHQGRSPVVTPFGWDGNQVQQRLTSRYSVPVWADNVVNMMALAEYSRHVGEEAADFVLVLIDEGIGAGLISNGRLHRGADGIAGELGHVAVTDDPHVVCWCGKTGCLTQVASTAAIERAGGRRIFAEPTVGREGRIEATTALRTILADDPKASEAFRTAGAATGRVLADVVNIFNPSLIVVGGRVAAGGDNFLQPLKTSLHSRSFAAAASQLQVSLAGDEEELGLLGAGIMAVDGILGPNFVERWYRR